MTFEFLGLHRAPKGRPVQTVLYWLCGGSQAEFAAVSLHHLRQRWKGRVVVCYLDEIARWQRGREAAERLAESFDVELVPFAGSLPRSPPTWRALPHILKGSLPKQFDGQVLYLDCDTVPVADVEELFTDGLTLTEYPHGTRYGCDLRDPKNWKRFEKTTGLEWKVLAPHCNTGVVAWGPNAGLDQWERVGWLTQMTATPSEQAIQYLAPAAEYRDCTWNCPEFVGTNAKIWHFVGSTHKRDGAELWDGFASETRRAVPTLNEWWGTFNTKLN